MRSRCRSRSSLKLLRVLNSALATTILATPLLASCLPYDHNDARAATQTLQVANIVYTGQIQSSYDFVIVGGGNAGLVLASRLSEDANTTVLVIEAGDTGDSVRSSIDIPGNAYYSSLLGTSYDWQFSTVPQPNLGNRVIPWARGKVLGGCTAVNGLYLVRPSQIEVDACAALIATQDGSQNSSLWNWDSLFAAMKKSENFTAPSQQIQQEGQIQFDPANHGETGPLHSSYPGYILPVVGNWTTTLDGIGIPPSADSNSGKGWGAFIATSAINPTNWTRSYSRSAYIDPLPLRSNLDILPNGMVTKIVFSSTNTSDGLLNATGVQLASGRGAPTQSVSANKEVILAGGAIGSPHVLMHSGIGPADVLQAAGVPLVYSLPGVGQHLQDHLSGEVVWHTSDDTAASLHASNATDLPNGTSSPFLSFINSATAYANITDLLGFDFAPTFQQEVSGEQNNSLQTLVPSQYPEVVAGYKAIYDTNLNTLMMSPVGQIEILFSLTGTAVGGSQSIAIQAALQHPFSQGRVYINSSDPFDYPVIDPQYLSHPADIVMLREGLKLARKLGQTAPLSSAMTIELSPGTNVSSDNDWDAWLAGQVGTEFHPACTCAMLPQSQGGVVDSKLRVYGTANVRVVDASVFPLEFAAHLQAPTYGLAEQAANLIRSQYNGVPLVAPNATSTSSSSSPSATESGTKKNGALSARGVTSPTSLLLPSIASITVLYLTSWL